MAGKEVDMQPTVLTTAWIRTAILSLSILIVALPIFRFAPLPPFVDQFGTFLLSALPAVIALGLYALLRLREDTVTLALGVLSALMFAFANVLQAVVQLMDGTVPGDARAVLGAAEPAAVSASLVALVVVLSMVKAIFSPLALFFFSVNMLRHPRFGPIIGGAGIVLAIAHYTLKVYWFPEHGSPILFPFTGVWLLVVLYRMATSLTWVESRRAQDVKTTGA
jgi:hypothetical protein